MAEDSKIKYRSINKHTRTVKAIDCLFFAYTDPAVFPATSLHSETVDSKPDFVVIDPLTDAVCVTVKDKTALWRHGDKTEEISDADGRAKIQKSEAKYQHSDYNSENINLLKTNLNKLVGLIGLDTAPQSTVNQIPIGFAYESAEAPLLVPKVSDGAGGFLPRNLYLGMHDAFEWTNNDDEIEVVVEELTIID